MRVSPSPTHGWVFLDKPEGMTATQAVSFVRHRFGTRKAGHAGTLDPLASGVLPIALGEATKTVPFMMDAVKAYAFTVQWGSATATGDREGAIIAHSPQRPTEDAIITCLPEFLGTIQQRPHQFSAIKVNGARAYDLARSGSCFELPPRPVVIHALTLTAHDGATASFVTTCGKGTYIRSLGQDLALRLGTFGHIVRLRRVRVGSVLETESITPAQLEAASPQERQMFLHPVERVLDDIPALDLTAAAADRIRHGQSVLLSEAAHRPAPVALVRWQGQAVAIGTLAENGQFAPSRVFNLV